MTVSAIREISHVNEGLGEDKRDYGVSEEILVKTKTIDKDVVESDKSLKSFVSLKNKSFDHETIGVGVGETCEMTVSAIQEISHANEVLDEDKPDYGVSEAILVKTKAIDKDAGESEKSLKSFVSLKNKSFDHDTFGVGVGDQETCEMTVSSMREISHVNEELGEDKRDNGVSEGILVKTKTVDKDAAEPEKSLKSFLNNKSFDLETFEVGVGDHETCEMIVSAIREISHVNEDLGEDKCDFGVSEGILVKTKTIDKDAVEPEKSLKSFVSLKNKSFDHETFGVRVGETCEMTISAIQEISHVNEELGEDKPDYGVSETILVKTKAIDKDAAEPEKSSKSFVSLKNKSFDHGTFGVGVGDHETCEMAVSSIREISHVNEELGKDKRDNVVSEGISVKTKTVDKDAVELEKSLKLFLKNKSFDLETFEVGVGDHETCEMTVSAIREISHVNEDLGEDKCDFGVSEGILVKTKTIDKDAAEHEKSLKSFVSLMNKSFDHETFGVGVGVGGTCEMTVSAIQEISPVNEKLGEDKPNYGVSEGILVKTKAIDKDAAEPEKSSKSFVSLKNKIFDHGTFGVGVGDHETCEMAVSSIREISHVNEELGEDKRDNGVSEGILVKTKTVDKDAAELEKSLKLFLKNKSFDLETFEVGVGDHETCEMTVSAIREISHVNEGLGEDKCDFGVSEGILVKTKTIEKDAAEPEKCLKSFVSLKSNSFDHETFGVGVGETCEMTVSAIREISHVNEELGKDKLDYGVSEGILVKTKAIDKDATEPEKSLKSFVSLKNKSFDHGTFGVGVGDHETCEMAVPSIREISHVNEELGEDKRDNGVSEGILVKTKTVDKDAAELEKSLKSFASLKNKIFDHETFGVGVGDEVLRETAKTDGKQSEVCILLEQESMEVLDSFNNKFFDQVESGRGREDVSGVEGLDSKTSCGRRIKGNVSKRKYRKKNASCQHTSCLGVSDEQNSLEHNEYDGHDDGDASPARKKVKEVLFLFRKLLQEDADKKEERPRHKRVDYQVAKILEDDKKTVNTDKKLLGHLPGVEVGDEFKCRMELSITGLHRQTQSGISFLRHGGKTVASSIVASADHTDDLDNSNVLIYTGQGTSVYSVKKPEDQKLEGGNLALKNSMDEKTPIRVIRGCDPYKRRFRKFVYIGLYLVESYKLVKGLHGNLVYKFWLERIPGQPEVVYKEIKKSKRPKARKGVCQGDISQEKVIPTCAVDSIDENPPSFQYKSTERIPDQQEVVLKEVKTSRRSKARKDVALGDVSQEEVISTCAVDPMDERRPPLTHRTTERLDGQPKVDQKEVKLTNAHKGVSLDDISPGKVVTPTRHAANTSDDEGPPPLKYRAIEQDDAQKGVKKSKKYEPQKHVCLDDISNGKVVIPTCAVNTKDDEIHPPLKYKTIKSIPGEPKVAQKGAKKRKRSKSQSICLGDISHGKEVIPIRAVNNIDDEKPPSFKYTTKLVYPDWCHITPPKGCDCINGCSDSKICSCAVKNGGEMPYNSNGTAVDGKILLYECGPSCKCPPSCCNRVSQRGIKFKLEIFKTKLRGWGLRSQEYIPLGGFICEYIGELLKDEEAEKRAGYDDYLFDIGKKYDYNTSFDEDLNSCKDVDDDDGFTIDAAEYGNVGRFINHSCTPNIYAQKILYDHEDDSIPHIMFFAAEKIHPFQELTYNYHYIIDQVRDANGNIKKKSCFCGSRECTGRLY